MQTLQRHPLQWCCKTHRPSCVFRASAGQRPNAARNQPNLRKATAADVPIIRLQLFREKMNPLSIRPENFTVVEDTSGELLAFAQLEPKPGAAQKSKHQVFEFRSLIVSPEHRHQGIGSLLLQSIVASCPHDIYLTTLARTTPFYEAVGFKVLKPSEVPRFLWFEAAAGTVVARLAVNDQLVVMHRPAAAQQFCGVAGHLWPKGAEGRPSDV